MSAPLPDDAPAHRHRGTRAIQRLVEFAPATGGLALWVHHRDLPAEPADPAGLGKTSPWGKAPTADDAPLVATDGLTVYYRAGFEALPVAAQAGLVAHEVLHIALRHAPRFVDLRQLLGDADLRLFNLCADAIVNSALGHLAWLQLPEAAVTLDRLLSSALGINQAVEISLLEWDVERLYRAIDDRQAPAPSGARQPQRQQAGGRQSGQSGQSGQRGQPGAGGAPSGQPRPAAAPDAGGERTEGRPGGQPDDQPAARPDGPRAARVRALAAHNPADLLPAPGAQGPPEAQAEQAREWAQRIVRAHAGDGGFSMLRALLADLPRTRTPWQQILRTVLARCLAPKLAVSWSRPTRSYLANQGRAGPHRRLPWEPGYSPGQAVARVVVIVDVSGSIEAALLGSFALEIEAITRRLEAGLVLVIGDHQVQRVAHFKPGRSDLRKIAFNGGGGTDFTPLLEEADKHHPDIAVVLTDLQGPARFRPRWPVVWAVPEAFASAVPPFGRKLVLG